MASTPLLAPSPNFSSWATRSPGGTSIKDLIAERQRNSPIPPPSPALSDGGFSTFDSPGTMHSAAFQSPTFHFEAHHPFADEPITPELRGSMRSADGEVVFNGMKEEENDGPVPPRPLRVSTPPVPPSPSSFTTRLSVQSLTITDGFSDCSPSPSIGSVRMAKITKVPPHPSRLSMSQSSMLSDSIEDAPEDDSDRVWDANALSRTSFVDRLPQELASILQESEVRNAASTLDAAAFATVEVLPVPPRKEAAEPILSPPTPPKSGNEKKGSEAMSLSGSKESELSSASWKVHLEEAAQTLSHDSDASAMQRMRSILGPKTRIISKAPWDGEVAEEDQFANPSSRRSTDASSSRPSTDAKPGSKVVKGQKENVKPVKSTRARSFSVLTSRRANTVDSKEQEEALKGLGLGLGIGPTITGSDSKRSLKSLLKASTVLAESETFSDFMSTTPPATVRATKHSSPAALPFSIRTMPERSESTRTSPRKGRIPPPVVFEMVSGPGKPLASLTCATPPKSAPASVTVFSERQEPVARSESKASLTVASASVRRQTAGNTTTPSPSTPSALASSLSSPVSPAPSSPSYFTTVPGTSTTGGRASPPGFGHKLISLEEARQLREVERERERERDRDRAATNARTRESTADSANNRRAVASPAQGPAPVAASSPSPSPAPTPLPPPAKVLKPKKSGFLKRMMGGDKHERPEMPSPPVPDSVRSIVFDSASYRPSFSSSASIPTLNSATPPSSLSRATGHKALESPLAAQPARVSFLPTPPPDASQRGRKGIAAPALSLRPVSMAFSAGLPSDFLAAPPGSKANPAGASPISAAGRSAAISRSTTSSSSPPAALVSPHAPSFHSSTSTTTTSLFDDAGPPSGSTTPVTPFFNLPIGAEESLTGHGHGHHQQDKSTSDRLAALQAEFTRAKSSWKAQQWELESQVRSLQIELEKQKEEMVLRNEPPREGEACERCGTLVLSESVGGEAVPGSTSVIQRPRFKGNGGVGTLFGSGVAA
ncbi:hypothetical protein JCM11641_006855 [Rhodosporidiobolus odoratus]